MENNDNVMSITECNEATREHVDKVQHYIGVITAKLNKRGIEHDASKFMSPEVETFAANTKKLARLSFQNKEGNDVSEEYQASLDAIKPALSHHYANNRHHPEHFPNGIKGMNLVDILEMFCDWKAASLRQHDGNLLKSIETNCKRFNITGALKDVFINSAELVDNE